MHHQLLCQAGFAAELVEEGAAGEDEEAQRNRVGSGSGFGGRLVAAIRTGSFTGKKNEDSRVSREKKKASGKKLVKDPILLWDFEAVFITALEQ